METDGNLIIIMGVFKIMLGGGRGAKLTSVDKVLFLCSADDYTLGFPHNKVGTNHHILIFQSENNQFVLFNDFNT